MEPSDIIAGLAFLLSIISVAWTITYNKRQSKDDRIFQTRDLFQIYMSSNMRQCRDTAWFFLDTLNKKDQPLVYSSLWMDAREKSRQDFDRLHQVLEFWYLLYAMDRMKYIDRPLARELFEYQYIHWKNQTGKLVADSKKDDWDRLDVLKPFALPGMDWLLQS
jgi:hypothetical protein